MLSTHLGNEQDKSATKHDKIQQRDREKSTMLLNISSSECRAKYRIRQAYNVYKHIIHFKYRSVNRTARAGFDKFSRFLLQRFLVFSLLCCFYITWNCLDIIWFYLHQNMHIQPSKSKESRNKSVEGIRHAVVHLKNLRLHEKFLYHRK